VAHKLNEEVEVVEPGPANGDLPTAHRTGNVAGPVVCPG
jgi:hypothetical protein